MYVLVDMISTLFDKLSGKNVDQLQMSLQVWNIRTNTPWSVQTLVGHSGTVRCLHLEGNRLVSGSTDGTIKVCSHFTLMHIHLYTKIKNKSLDCWF